MAGFLTPTHILIIVLVVAILFGLGKLPDAAKQLGRGVRELKQATGIDEFRSDIGEVKESLRSTASAATTDLAATPTGPEPTARKS